jgi:hypothetical protein
VTESRSGEAALTTMNLQKQRSEKAANIILTVAFVFYGIVTYLISSAGEEDAAGLFAFGSFFAYCVGLTVGRMTTDDPSA